MEKRINLLFIGFGLIVTVMNTWFFVDEHGFTGQIVKEPIFILPAIGLLYFSLLQFFGGKTLQVSQLIFLFAIAAISIIDGPENIYGMGFMLLTIYLLYKYGYLQKHFILKSVIIILLIYVLILISFFGNAHFSAGINVMAFVFFFFVAFSLGEWQWIQTLRKKDIEYRDKLKEFRGEEVDLEQAGFSRRELEVGKLLMKYPETDKELAWRMNISPETFRNHLKSMRKKLNVNTKQQLIEKIRWFYRHEELEKENSQN